MQIKIIRDVKIMLPEELQYLAKEHSLKEIQFENFLEIIVESGRVGIIIDYKSERLVECKSK